MSTASDAFRTAAGVVDWAVPREDDDIEATFRKIDSIINPPIPPPPGENKVFDSRFRTRRKEYKLPDPPAKKPPKPQTKSRKRKKRKKP